MSTYTLFFPGLSFPLHKIASFPARLCLQHGQLLPLAGPEGRSQALIETQPRLSTSCASDEEEEQNVSSIYNSIYNATYKLHLQLVLNSSTRLL